MTVAGLARIEVLEMQLKMQKQVADLTRRSEKMEKKMKRVMTMGRECIDIFAELQAWYEQYKKDMRAEAEPQFRSLMHKMKGVLTIYVEVRD